MTLCGCEKLGHCPTCYALGQTSPTVAEFVEAVGRVQPAPGSYTNPKGGPDAGPDDRVPMPLEQAVRLALSVLLPQYTDVKAAADRYWETALADDIDHRLKYARNTLAGALANLQG